MQLRAEGECEREEQAAHGRGLRGGAAYSTRPAGGWRKKLQPARRVGCIRPAVGLRSRAAGDKATAHEYGKKAVAAAEGDSPGVKNYIQGQVKKYDE
ncbi:MAG: hypothetical protein K2P78_09210 [Gemmataceae bacterium]|nr:hypothetical protein [Gemmataceae bacterium]